jgi:hypothetical protein
MILNPSGVICGSLQPIVKSHFQLSFSSPAGSWSSSDNAEILSFPDVMNSVEAQDYIPFNSQIPYASRKSKSTGNLKFRFFDGTSGMSFWQKWFKLVYNADEDKVGILPDYCGRGEVTIYKPNGTACSNMSTWGKIIIDNCWPSALGTESLDMQSDEPFGYSITLQMMDIDFQM